LITAIHIKGLARVGRTEANRLIFSQEGDFFSKTRLEKDIARLKKSGLFERVEARYQAQHGLVEITFTVVERTLIKITGITFTGLRMIQAPDLQKRLELKGGGYYDAAALKRDAHRILEAYSEIGLFRASLYVQGYWGGDEKRREVRLEYVVNEDQPARIRRVEIAGLSTIPIKEVLAILSSRPADMLTPITGQGLYHPYFVAQDKYALDNFFMDRGFLERQIKGPFLQVSRDRREVTMRYELSEGRLYRYKTIVMRGDILGRKEELEKILTIHPGKIFSRTELLNRNVDRLRRHYRDAGYAFAKVEPIPLVDQIRRELSIVFRIEKGIQARIGEIEIVGNAETQEFVIRRRVLFRKGDLFSESKLRQSQRSIFALGYFEKNDDTYGIQAQVERSLDPAQVTLRFIVRERWTWTLLPNFTFLPGYGFLAFGQVGKQNFLGLGQSLSLSGGLATSLRLWSFSLVFSDPSVASSPLSLFFSGNISYNAVPNLGYAVTRLGATVGTGVDLGTPALRLSVFYNIGQFDLSPQEDFVLKIEGFTTGSWLRSSVRLLLSYDDRFVRARAPVTMNHTLSFSHTSRLLGSNYDLSQLDARARFFVTLPLRMQLKIAASLGWMWSSDRTGIPSFERYRLGGDRDMRGFPIQVLAPTRLVPSAAGADFRPVEVNWGGSKMLMLNIEWEMPLTSGGDLAVVAFFDAGNTYDDHESFFDDQRHRGLPLGLFMNVGFGLRWRLVGAGLFRFEFGFPITARPGDAGMLFWLTIGESVF
jgi:outer membrane protein insertion porin family